MGVLLAGFGAEQSGTTGMLKARIQMNGSGNSVRDSLASANGRIAVILPCYNEEAAIAKTVAAFRAALRASR